MNVLSLFDGISCGQIALERANVKIDTYYASEIDKYAIQVTRNKYPKTIQLGIVEDLFYIHNESQFEIKNNGSPSWLNEKVNNGIDLLIGGSPCQSFSNLGDGSGFTGKSKLFFQYLRLLKQIKPKYFLLENVTMKKEWENMISKELGVRPIRLNSSLVSAQNRERLYWTNIPVTTIPMDKKIILSDILEEKVDEKYYLSEKAIKYITNKMRIEKGFTKINGDKSTCFPKYYNNSKNGTFLCVDANGRIDSEKTGTLTKRYSKGVENYGSNPFIYDGRFRKLTPLEAERLQTLPDNYTSNLSDTQRYFCIGNGWTVDIIAHILKHIK